MKLQVTSLLLFVSISLFGQNLSNGLQAHYKFDGNLLDVSTNQNHLGLNFGTLQFSSVLNSSATDAAVNFDNNTRHASLNNFSNANFTATTISLWFKSPTVPTHNETILQGAFVGFGIYIAANTGHIKGFYDGSSLGSITSSQSLTDGNWHNIILQSDGNTTSLFVDGQLDGSIQESMYTYSTNSNSPILYFGHTNLGANPFLGDLNEVRIYDRTLTSTERTLLSAQPIIASLISLEKETINLYPNPTNNVINIISNSYSEFPYVIYDAVGRATLSGKGSMIDVESLSPGVYYIRINEVITKSFVKI